MPNPPPYRVESVALLPLYQSYHPIGHHRSGHTQNPRQDSKVTSGVPPEVSDTPSYHVESVALLPLYQSYHPISHHTSGHTQDLREDSTATSGVPPEVPNPPSYRVESVALSTLYQLYYPISFILLHAFRSMHNHIPLASSKSISLSAHALLTPFLYLKMASLSPFLLLLPTYTLF